MPSVEKLTSAHIFIARFVVFTSVALLWQCFIESDLTFSFISSYGSLSLKTKQRLQGIVTACSKIAGVALNDLPHLYKMRTLKTQSILAHPLSEDIKLLLQILNANMQDTAPLHTLGDQTLQIPLSIKYRVMQFKLSTSYSAGSDHLTRSHSELGFHGIQTRFSPPGIVMSQEPAIRRTKTPCKLWMQINMQFSFPAGLNYVTTA